MELKLVTFIEENIDNIINNIFQNSNYHISDKIEEFKEIVDYEEFIESLYEKFENFFGKNNELSDIEDSEELYIYLAEELEDYLMDVLNNSILDDNLYIEEEE